MHMDAFPVLLQCLINVVIGNEVSWLIILHAQCGYMQLVYMTVEKIQI